MSDFFSHEVVRTNERIACDRKVLPDQHGTAEQAERASLNLAPERVYFLSCAGANAIKIGRSDDPETRLKACQTGCPLALSLLGSIPGDRAKERELHARFAALHIHGEWFRAEIELVEFIGNAMATAMGAPRLPSDPLEFEFEHDGERLTLSAWCRRLGLKEMAVLGRLVEGIPFSEAITHPWVLANRVVARKSRAERSPQ